MIYGRLWMVVFFLDEDEKRDIAEELQTTVEDLYMPRSEEKYHAAGCIECRGEFSHADTKAVYFRFIGCILRCTGIDSGELGHFLMAFLFMDGKWTRQSLVLHKNLLKENG